MERGKGEGRWKGKREKGAVETIEDDQQDERSFTSCFSLSTSFAKGPKEKEKVEQQNLHVDSLLKP